MSKASHTRGRLSTHFPQMAFFRLVAGSSIIAAHQTTLQSVFTQQAATAAFINVKPHHSARFRHTHSSHRTAGHLFRKPNINLHTQVRIQHTTGKLHLAKLIIPAIGFKAHQKIVISGIKHQGSLHNVSHTLKPPGVIPKSIQKAVP